MSSSAAVAARPGIMKTLDINDLVDAQPVAALAAARARSLCALPGEAYNA